MVLPKTSTVKKIKQHSYAKFDFNFKTASFEERTMA